jgi:hypothetical protein
MPATVQELGRLAARRGRWGEVAERAAALERAGAVAEAVELRRQVPGIRSEREPG